MTIQDYVLSRTSRGECQCGKCIDKGNNPDPTNHTVDVFFFVVGLTDEQADAETFTKLTAECKGEFAQINPLDGEQHSFIELGGMLGSQELALRYIGLGKILGVLDLLTPLQMGMSKDDPIAQQMAGSGLVMVRKAL